MHYKIKRYAVFCFVALAILFIFLQMNFKLSRVSCFQNVNKEPRPAFASGSLPFTKGEKIIYNVSLFGIKIGQSQLQFAGKTKLNGKEAQLIILSTNVTNLKDVERIYADSQTFLPLRVERSVIFFGKKMNIVEEYDVKEKTFTLLKNESGKTTKQVIKSDKPLENIISSIFFFRKSAAFETGQVFNLELPLAKCQMKVRGLVDFNTANKKYKAYLLESVPSKYRIWLDESYRKIPLRLDGAVGFGSTAMVMTEFVSGDN